MNKQRPANTGLAKLAVPFSADTFVVNQSLVLRINICGENRHLRQARNRYGKWQGDRSKLEHSYFERTTESQRFEKLKELQADPQTNAFAAHLILSNRTINKLYGAIKTK
jgi:hypothetical protein